MSLQRRLLLALLVCAPLVWGVTAWFSIQRARHEVNELFDTELIRLARQVYATLGSGLPGAAVPLPPVPRAARSDVGESDLDELAVAVWDAAGRLAVFDREGAHLPYLRQASGFVDQHIGERAWRIYYLQSGDGRWLVAAGQSAYERDELVYGLALSQLVPWLLVLPVLLVVMAWAVRQALAPMRQLTEELASRGAHDLHPLALARPPAELQPVLVAINDLFRRIDQLLVRERRFTADAAHELRTPLAVLGAQWDVVRRAATPAERAEAERKFGDGLTRMGRLVTQLLALSRAEAGELSPAGRQPVDWRAIVEESMNDCLALAERRRIELACDWPADGRPPLPLQGDAHLLTVLLRNLLDNAVRYATEGSTVLLRFESDRLAVENDAAPLAEDQRQRLGERFYRPEGQLESGTGLGLSIVRQIAQLHGLALETGPVAAGRGFRVTLRLSAP